MRQEVCSGLVALMMTRPDMLVPHMGQVQGLKAGGGGGMCRCHACAFISTHEPQHFICKKGSAATNTRVFLPSLAHSPPAALSPPHCPVPPQVIEYMLASNQDSHEGVALESAEFWMAFLEAEADREVLQPFLPKLIPVLLKNMVRALWWAGMLGGGGRVAVHI